MIGSQPNTGVLLLYDWITVRHWSVATEGLGHCQTLVLLLYDLVIIKHWSVATVGLGHRSAFVWP